MGGAAPSLASAAHAASNSACGTPASGHVSKHQSGIGTSAYLGVEHIESTRRSGSRSRSSSGMGCDCHRCSSTPSSAVRRAMHRSPVCTRVGGKSGSTPAASSLRSMRVSDACLSAHPP